MTIKEQLDADFKNNYKAGNKDAVNVLRAIRGAIATEEKSGKQAVEFNDDKVQSLIAREVKKRKSTADEYVSAGVQDRADKELWEAEFLSQYLPEQLSDEDVETVVDSVLATGETNMGLVMKNVMAQVKGKADGKTVKQIVQNKLN